jgi:SAM-dependent methyltransferase
MLDDREDAFGRMLLDAFEGRGAVEIVERDDGFIAASATPLLYMSPFRRWPAHHRRAMRLVRGRILDIGAGAGRVALHLQTHGHDVVSIDVSPGAVEVCRRRGVRDARVCPIEDVDESLGRFDTIVLLGNNFGLLGSRAKAKRLLRRFHGLTSERGRMLAETRDIYATDDPVHLAYQERNRRRGRMSGQIRLRIRHGLAATPWFDYLMVSRAELEGLVEGTGWKLTRTIDSDDTYVAVLEKA